MPHTISVENLGKRFSRYHAKKPITFREAALSGLRRIKPVDHFWALRRVSFDVAEGEMLGIIGHNGAGKSTLLQLLGKIIHPNEGHITMRGQIGALLDLGAGFHGDLTGRENVFVSAIVAGLARREVARRFDQIVTFAELEMFIDNPLRTYSSGMMMRLAFSVAVHTDPDILLVDEFLSVGDLSFQTKCLDRITGMKARGCAIVLVSHDTGKVKRVCDHALWLKQGNIVAYGDPTVVVDQYAREMLSQTQRLTPHTPSQLTRDGTALCVHKNRFGSLEAEITDVRLLPQSIIESGAPLCIEVDYETLQPLESAIFGVTISQENGEACLTVNTTDLGIPHIQIQKKGTIKLVLDRIDLCRGQYFIDVGMYKQDLSYAYDYHWRVYSLTVDSVFTTEGILQPPMRWEVLKLT